MTASERIREAREAREARSLRETRETHNAIQAAYAAWRSNDLYHGRDGHYRSKSNKGRISPHSRTIRALYSDSLDFHRDATRASAA